ncbi:Nucleolar complex protein 3 [Chamberlinius hualienensis]
MGKQNKKSTKVSKKVSIVKHSNKKFSKLLKRKKSMKASVAQFNMGATAKFKDHLKHKNQKSGNFEDDNREEKKAHLTTTRKKAFLNGKRKVEEEDPDDETEDQLGSYENQHRRFNVYQATKNVKTLLPIKDKSGLIQKYMDIDEPEQIEQSDSEVEDDKSVAEESAAEDEPEDNVINKIESVDKNNGLNREKKIAVCKLRIASLSTAILADPTHTLSHLNELKSMLDDGDPSIAFIQKKLAMVSMSEIFKDIIPGYKIRNLNEEDKQLRAETKHLQTYELGLLKHYKTYLQKLETLSSVLVSVKKAKSVLSESRSLTAEQIMKLGEVAVKCLCDLLVVHPHFNFSHNIVMTILPFAATVNENVAVICCDSLKMLYKQDKLGDISLEGVKQTAKLIKDRAYNVNPKVLESFLHLKIKDVKLEDIIDERAKKLTHKEKLQSMSRRELKKSKKMSKLENELQETQAEESKLKKMTFQTEIIKQVFLTYFRVLKKVPNCKLLGAVLEGLSKFAHLINIDFLDDLISVLHDILDRGILNVRQCLHCVLTVFTILSGQGTALNIDPLRFYTHCYKQMLSIDTNSVTLDEVPLLVTCMDMMINKRKKQVSLPRVFAFIHRGCMLALQLNHNSQIALLSVIRSILQNFPRVDILLDGEASQAHSAFLPELDDPEHCNARSTALWELHYLQLHYHPTVAKMASHIAICCPLIGDGQLSHDLARKSATELFDEYNPEKLEAFNPPLTSMRSHKSSRRMKTNRKHRKLVSQKLQQKISSLIDVEYTK